VRKERASRARVCEQNKMKKGFGRDNKIIYYTGPAALALQSEERKSLCWKVGDREVGFGFFEIFNPYNRLAFSVLQFGDFVKIFARD
jgi:hypothetical protein